MPNPVTHVLVPMFFLETYRRYFAKRKFSKWYVFLAGFFGGAPDLDLIYAWFMTGDWNTSYHRNATHTLLIPIALLAITLVIYLLRRKKVLRHKAWNVTSTVMLMMSIGIASHVMLDAFDGLTRWFWPFYLNIGFLPNLVLDKYRAALVDGVLLFAWLLYDEEMLNSIIRTAKRILRTDKQ
jgi:membrane-bound metal-dependent hydrolase YbcI (DUF457 family)